MVQGVFSWVDLVMTPVWLLILYLLAYAISHIKYRDQYLRKHFMWGLTVKFIGCLGFIAVYAFYYGYGDTFGYYNAATELRNIYLENPTAIWKTMLSSQLNPNIHGDLGIINFDSSFSNSANFMVVRLAVIFGVFTFNSYIASSLFFAFSSFIGIWTLYRVVVYIYPSIYKAVTIPILYLPSVFFWGSSMMKDSIVIGFLGLLTYAIYRLYFHRRMVFLSIVLVFLSVYVLFNVKQYVIIAYAPALILWVSLGPLKRLQTRERWIAAPFLGAIALGIIAVAFPLLQRASKQYAMEQILNTAEKTAEYIHRTTPHDGSSYTLGDVSYTPLGIAKVFPRAVTVTLYQPFLYQVRNPVMLLSAIESAIFLIGTIFVFLKLGFIKFFGNIFNQPFLLMCLVFSIIFAFAIGISTYNFGSLVRYKIPCLPFYGIAVIIPYFLNRKRLNNFPTVD